MMPHGCRVKARVDPGKDDSQARSEDVRDRFPLSRLDLIAAGFPGFRKSFFTGHDLGSFDAVPQKMLEGIARARNLRDKQHPGAGFAGGISRQTGFDNFIGLSAKLMQSLKNSQNSQSAQSSFFV
jgi:hypothetical protein